MIELPEEFMEHKKEAIKVSEEIDDIMDGVNSGVRFIVIIAMVDQIFESAPPELHRTLANIVARTILSRMKES